MDGCFSDTLVSIPDYHHHHVIVFCIWQSRDGANDGARSVGQSGGQADGLRDSVHRERGSHRARQSADLHGTGIAAQVLGRLDGSAGHAAPPRIVFILRGGFVARHVLGPVLIMKWGRLQGTFRDYF